MLLLACHTPQTAPPVTSAPTTEVAAAERIPLTLNPEEMEYHELKGTVTFSPGSNQRSASYEHYTMSIDSLEAVLGGRPEAPVEVLFEVESMERDTMVPDPSMPQPEGGFHITRWTGQLVEG